jgi:DNA repair exonuclease SbcCD ATPase subunit
MQLLIDRCKPLLPSLPYHLFPTARLKDERASLAARDAELASCQKQLGLASVQLREAQRAITAAEEAQATAAASLEDKAGHISRLQQQLAEAKVSLVGGQCEWGLSCKMLRVVAPAGACH